MAYLRRSTAAAATLTPRPAQAIVRWASTNGNSGGEGTGRRGLLDRPPPPQQPQRRLRRRQRGGGLVEVAALGILVYAGYYGYTSLSAKSKGQKKAEAALTIPKAEVAVDSTANSISPQHRQVQNSLENPGVFAWGSNDGHVVAPDSLETVVREPRRITFFDGQLLRDLLLDQDVGLAVTEKGDLVQWGAAYFGQTVFSASSPTPKPATTLIGKDIIKVARSKDRVIALSKSGTIYSLPISQADQQQAATASKTASSPGTTPTGSYLGHLFWSSGNNGGPAQYRTITPPGLGFGERVVGVCSGAEHGLLLTSTGRVFSFVASFEAFPSKGQMGVPGLTWQTRSQSAPLDQPYEVPGLRGIPIKQIATGDTHSVVLDKTGRIFAFGDNGAGQLGIPASPTFPSTDLPTLIPVEGLYPAGDAIVTTSSVKPVPPRVTSIAAGGSNTFFTVDSEIGSKDRKRIVADTWACGSGIYGNLGTGKWVHISLKGPSKVKALSGLSEYNEATGEMVPLRLASLSVGATHTSAVLDNATRVAANTTKAPAIADAPITDINFGADVMWWGGNEYYQLGTGKRSNQCEPVHIPPLDREPNTVLSRLGSSLGGRLNLGQARERMGITPRTTARLGKDGKSRKASVEQRVVCGRFVSGVYSAT